jgi:thiopurine S-methyltransferase
VSETWLDRWQEGRIGWHEEDGNASLKKHWRATGRTVFVPMCGKSFDLRWIAAQGNRVVGVELSDIAIESFFAEQGLEFTVLEDELPRYDGIGVDISIYCGNLFDLTSICCDAHYDRGALIALPASQRSAYALHVRSLLTDDAEQLVITLDYDDEIAKGPPFSVADEELLTYWPDLDCVDQYDDIANAPPKFLDAGLTALMEKVWQSS